MGTSTVSGPFRSQNGFQELVNGVWTPVGGGGGGGGALASVRTLTNSVQYYDLPNPDEVDVPVGTIYQVSALPFAGPLDVQRDIIFRYANTITYPPAFNGIHINNISSGIYQIQAINPNPYYQWSMYTGTPGTTGIISGQATLVYCGVGTLVTPFGTLTRHLYTVTSNTELYVFGGG
jgi:hypothetical protein